MKYKGSLLEQGIGFGFAIVFIGILLGAGAVALGAMSGSALSGPGLDNQTILNASKGLLNLSLQMPTVGTIAGVGLIILVLFVSIGAYVMHQKSE